MDESSYIFKSNKEFKSFEFQNKHKCALLHILFKKYEEYKKQNYKFIIPEEIRRRTELYLELSCNILGWFKDNYEETGNSKDIVKLRDVFNTFKESEYYFNLGKNEKRKYNYKYFCNYFETNVFFKKYYVNGDDNNYPNHIQKFKCVADIE